MVVCRVLGPTEVEAGGAGVDLGGPLPRRLFTALVMAEGEPVSDGRLAEAVWGPDPPSRAAAALQVYVSRLRAALGSGGRDLLERTGSGYRLRVPPGAVDADRFVQQVERGRRLLAEDNAAPALHAFTEALTWWHGEPYADLLAGPDVLAARSRLAELREVAIEERLAARLSTGDAPGAVAELDAAVQAAPYRERRWALLILGLYRCGRQGDTLAALRRVRALLADELGVDPGPELQRLERLVLAQDLRLLLPETPSTAPPAPAGGLAAARCFGRPLSSFLGRDRELTTVARLLAEQRLVTLVGPAGVGKTRLAVEYATTLPDADGPWLVRLADVGQPEVIVHAIANAVGLAQVADEPRHALRDALAGRVGLLVLDNCEHLVDATAELTIELLAACPMLRVLATSREPLGIDGEATVTVHPLPLRSGDGADGSAMTLLLDRIRAVRPGWTPSDEERAQVRQVCAALDGLPLAIELAAARARLLGLGEIAEHLHDRFALLGPVARGSLAPHATLQAAIAWSVELLSDDDRGLLLRLWPFEGGFPLEAAEAVRPVGSAGTSALESLSSLVTRSVVSADTTVAPTRYRLLETIRAYCQAIDPDPGDTRKAHATWVRDLAAQCAADVRGQRHGGRALRILDRELPNLRAGIAHDLAHQPEHALRTVGLLDWFWLRGGHSAEGRRLIDAALRAAPHASHANRARAYLARVISAALFADEAEVRRMFEEARVAIGEPTDDEHRALYASLQYYCAMFWQTTGQVQASHDAADEAATLGTQLGLDWIRIAGLRTRNAALIHLGHVAAGEAGLIDTIMQAQQTGQLWSAGWSELALALSYLNRATAHADPSSRAARGIDALCRALARFRHQEDSVFTLAVLYTGVHALVLAGRPHDAGQLRAAVHHHAIRLGFRPDLLRRFSSPDSDHMVDTALSPDDRDTAAAEGADLSWLDMINLLTSARTAIG
ncbi:winged helix-turn-helix domain-containing protein [Amycolatopsis sp. NBC_01488]|uniref:BTAD domain-containing putative transcriptional regulator n=1 Tax=Amycolatopsis sp. NBC_01488 TaxID=2903563 RepID=UPI002E2D0092|nr:BTAD domain-containing putative transcriptional regulator [Amycolatopsis sp. NBC_01488]